MVVDAGGLMDQHVPTIICWVRKVGKIFVTLAWPYYTVFPVIFDSQHDPTIICVVSKVPKIFDTSAPF